jgi:DNA invertase Pin-like site-specific DNA recombinase
MDVFYGLSHVYNHKKLVVHRRDVTFIGYARVSTEDQNNLGQLDALRAAGCSIIFEEKASGASRSRPELARVLAKTTRGDTVVVVRVDRLARSLSHLLQVIERLEGIGAHFKSLSDPIDTSTPQGLFALQVLGAAAELERALIRERTKAGLQAARKRGRVGGNPALRRRDPGACKKMSQIRDRQYLTDLLATMDAWMPRVREMRPFSSWAQVAKALNLTGSPERPWTAERLSRGVRRLVSEGFADSTLLKPVTRRLQKPDAMLVVAGIKGADPALSLRALAGRLNEMRILTVRGHREWSASTVKNLLDQARERGLLR